jgi:hypothetical protein
MVRASSTELLEASRGGVCDTVQVAVDVALILGEVWRHHLLVQVGGAFEAGEGQP